MFGCEYPGTYSDWLGNSALLSSFGSESGLLTLQKLDMEARAANLRSLEKILQQRADDMRGQEAETTEAAKSYREVLKGLDLTQGIEKVGKAFERWLV